MNTKISEYPTLLDAMMKIENGQKWWTLKEIASHLEKLGWIGSAQEQMQKADILTMIALALGNDQLKIRLNKATRKCEFRVPPK